MVSCARQDDHQHLGRLARKARGLSALALLLVVAFTGGCSQWERSLSRAPFTVRSRGNPERLSAIAARAAFVYQVYAPLFGVDEGGLGHLEIVDTVPAGEVRIGAVDPGRYEGRSRRVVLSDTPDDELLLHEIAHHFIRGLQDRVPPWLNEGLAVYLAWSAVGTQRIATGGLPIHHVRDVVALARAGRLRTLSELARLGPADFYAPDEDLRARNYSESWAAVFFLLEEALPREPMPARLRSLLRLGSPQVHGLDARFREFWNHFDVLARLKRRLRDTDPLVRHLAAVLLGILGEARGIPPLMHVAASREEDRLIRLAALRAVGTILLQVGPGGFRWGEDRLRGTLDRLMVAGDSQVAAEAGELRSALQIWNRATFLTHFALVLVADPVYPSRTYSRQRPRAMPGESAPLTE